MATTKKPAASKTKTVAETKPVKAVAEKKETKAKSSAPKTSQPR